MFLLVLLVGTSGAATYYHNQRSAQANRAADLGNQVADLNARIQSLNQKIASMGPQCIPDPGYDSCDQEVQALTAQLTDLTNQRNNLTDIVNLQKIQVIANSVGISWAGCGDTGQPGCMNQSPLISIPEINSFATQCAASSSACYAGYLKINWTATLSVHLYFQFAIGTGTATTTSTSGTTGSTIIPYPGGSTLTNGDLTSNFQNDVCAYDALNNLHCPGGSLAYNATYVY